MSTLLELKKETVKLNKRILDYTESIFNEFIQKRTNLIKNIENTDLSKLNKNKIINYINNLKDILDPIKNVNNSIDTFTSLKNQTCNNQIENDNQTNFLIFYFLFKDFFFGCVTESSDEVSELISETESVSSSLSDSVSVSLSVSLSESE